MDCTADGRYLGEDWIPRAIAPAMWEQVNSIPDEEIWWRHQALKERPIAHTRYQSEKARENRGEDGYAIEAAEMLLDPNALTIGFARRSAYKRGVLILRDAERALNIFADRDRPVQIIFAGKAHPADEEGKRIIQRSIEWCRHSAIQHRVALIEDYDIYTGQKLVQGVDVWLNNPRRPLNES